MEGLGGFVTSGLHLKQASGQEAPDWTCDILHDTEFQEKSHSQITVV